MDGWMSGDECDVTACCWWGIGERVDTLERRRAAKGGFVLSFLPCSSPLGATPA